MFSWCYDREIPIAHCAVVVIEQRGTRFPHCVETHSTVHETSPPPAVGLRLGGVGVHSTSSCGSLLSGVSPGPTALCCPIVTFPAPQSRGAMGFEPQPCVVSGVKPRAQCRGGGSGYTSRPVPPLLPRCQQGYIWPHICIAASRRTWATRAALGGVRAPGAGGAGNCHTRGQESPGRRLFIAELLPLGHSLHPGSSGRMGKVLLSCDFVSPVVHPTAAPHLPFLLLGSPFLQQLEGEANGPPKLCGIGADPSPRPEEQPHRCFHRAGGIVGILPSPCPVPHGCGSVLGAPPCCSLGLGAAPPRLCPLERRKLVKSSETAAGGAVSASQALMSPLHVPQVLLSCHSHGRGGGRCPHGRFVINLCKTRGESCKNISFSILSSKHPEPTGVGRPRAWHGQGHGAGAWSTVLVHAISAAAAVSFSCMGWGSWSRAGGLHRGPSSSATCASLQQEVQWEPGRFLRSGADPCGASLWFPPALTSWHSHATCSPVRSSGRAAPAAPPHQHPSGSPWVMRGAGTPWHTQQPLLLALGLFLSCTHCAHCTQRSSCRALCAQTSPCNPRQPLRRASTLHPGDSMCTPCTQLPPLHHSSCTSAAADPAVPRVPSMLPWCCGAPHGAVGGTHIADQPDVLPAGCIADLVHCC